MPRNKDLDTKIRAASRLDRWDAGLAAGNKRTEATVRTWLRGLADTAPVELLRHIVKLVGDHLFRLCDIQREKLPAAKEESDD